MRRGLLAAIVLVGVFPFSASACLEAAQTAPVSSQSAKWSDASVRLPQRSACRPAPPEAKSIFSALDSCGGDYVNAEIDTDDPAVLARLSSLAPGTQALAVCSFKPRRDYCLADRVREPYSSELRALAAACEVTTITRGHIR